MTVDIASLRHLQGALNSAFEAVFAASDSSNTKDLAIAKEQLAGLSHATAATALGPASTIIGMGVTPVNYMALRIAVDFDAFSIIAANRGGPTKLTEIADKSGANPSIIKRILRLVCALGFAKQVDVSSWEPTPLTHAMTVPSLRDFAVVHFDKHVEIAGRFPAWLRQHQMQTTWEEDDNIVKEVLGTDIWGHYATHPEESRTFDSAMSAQESWPAELAPSYPMLDNVDGLNPESVTFVDVGGGFGQAIGKLRKAHPSVPGKFVLQDLPKTIDAIVPGRAEELGFEAVVHNFFEVQPIRGAKYYHLRRILHDWNDRRSLAILKALHPALEAGYSKLLIHDFVLPDVGAGPMECGVDILMMTTCDGMERTISEWHKLLEKAGYKIDAVHQADVGTMALIEASVI